MLHYSKVVQKLLASMNGVRTHPGCEAINLTWHSCLYEQVAFVLVADIFALHCVAYLLVCLVGHFRELLRKCSDVAGAVCSLCLVTG